MDANYIVVIQEFKTLLANGKINEMEFSNILITAQQYYFIHHNSDIIDSLKYEEIIDILHEEFNQIYYDRKFSDYLYDYVTVFNLQKYSPDGSLKTFISNVLEEYRDWNIL